MGNCQGRKQQETNVKDNSNPHPTPPMMSQGSTVICHICCENGQDTIIPISKVTPKCNSIRSICQNCLAHHLQEQILGKGDISNLPCLCTASCKVKLEFEHVRRYATQEVFRRYDEHVTRRFLESQNEFAWCSGQRCGSGQLHATQDNYPIFTCHACRAKTCFTHGCPWHHGRTCAQYDRDAKKSDEVALLQLLENSSSKIKRCPQCRQGVEKNRGCNHMTCRCGYEFCWLCLAPYGGSKGIFAIGNSAHRPTCRDYRR